ncbi:MAG: hypothetical protein ACRDN0_20165 [Trebonia sp.]
MKLLDQRDGAGDAGGSGRIAIQAPEARCAPDPVTWSGDHERIVVGRLIPEEEAPIRAGGIPPGSSTLPTPMTPGRPAGY